MIRIKSCFGRKRKDTGSQSKCLCDTKHIIAPLNEELEHDEFSPRKRDYISAPLVSYTSTTSTTDGAEDNVDNEGNDGNVDNDGNDSRWNFNVPDDGEWNFKFSNIPVRTRPKLIYNFNRSGEININDRRGETNIRND